MARRKNRQKSYKTNVWLSPPILYALEELGDGRKSFIAYTRTRAARFLLVSMFEGHNLGTKPINLGQEPKYLPERREGEKLVRLPMLTFTNLRNAIDVIAEEQRLSRSATIRRMLTLAVNERLDLDNMDLSLTIRKYEIVRRK
jgi:hypothetical protein